MLGRIASIDISVNPDEWSDRVAALWRNVRDHVREEEQKLFPRVRVSLSTDKLNELGQQLEQAKTSNLDGELLSQPLTLLHQMHEQASL